MYELNNMIDDCCKDCKDRHIGCHNIETCSKWADHEKQKQKIYEKRLEDMRFKDQSLNHPKRKMKRRGKILKSI